VRVGDDVRLLPGERAAKVRGLQVHGESVDEARAGVRCAVNLVGVDRDEVARGETLVHPGVVEATHLVDVRIRTLRTNVAPLARRARVLVHHGTAQALAQVVLVGEEEVEPGDQALAQLHLDTPLAALPGDHFVLRGFAPQEHYGTTIGGGEILRVHAPKVRRSSEEAAAALRRIAEAQPVERVGLEIHASGPAGTTKAALLGRLGLAPRALDAALDTLVNTREVLRAEDHFLAGEVVARLEAALLAAVDAFHAAQPHKEGAPREELRGKLPRALPPRLFDALIEGLTRRGAIVAERDVVRRAKHGAAASVTPHVARLVAELRRHRLETPPPKDFPALIGAGEREARAAMDVAQRSGQIVKIRPEYFVEKSVLDELRAALRAHLQQHGQITAQEWKALVGSSRKWTIPLAEHFDAEKVTMRVGEIRKLRG
jgi:selenocysteine-specific elongation factor